ncbi:MAG: hypothetical protein CMM47_02130 [Rhodospirillaceae bacterium]|nr:hypothetical protein [Rhodospirillaceae bacterium]
MNTQGGNLLRSLREIYFRSPIADWRLNRTRKGRILVPVGSAWPGDPERGRTIVEGTFTIEGDVIAEVKTVWSQIPKHVSRVRYLHGFSWLRDLKELGGRSARLCARELVADWLDHYGTWHPISWRADFVGERLSNLLSVFDFFCESAEDRFRARVLTDLERQFAHLCRDFEAVPDGIGRLRAASGLVVAGTALGCEDEQFERCEHWLENELQRQVNSDGGHASRSPDIHCNALMALIDLRNALRARDRIVPKSLDNSIDSMCAMLRLWRHGDGLLALFHQSTQMRRNLLENVIAQSESRRKAPAQAQNTGFQRLSAGRTCVIVDTGGPSSLSDGTHASPLAFEMSAGRHRIIVNCGTSFGDTRWQESLRTSAAHSMLVIDGQNAAPIDPDSMVLPTPICVEVKRVQEDGANLMEANHDGYRKRFGLLHRRRLYLSAAGDDLRGEERLIYTGDPGDIPNTAEVRFHLHPRISASILQSKASVLLRPPNGGGWRLRTDSGLYLNESIYFGSGSRQRTEQIVISRSLEGVRTKEEITIKWALRREDARSH